MEHTCENGLLEVIQYQWGFEGGGGGGGQRPLVVLLAPSKEVFTYI